ncbi:MULTISPECIES: filamentous hemagglutinin N-terminal domain-containing protein [unclassified Arsenophonus]|uniref:two-partner secretion domain-containing protein n=1 Tax=unclassified Arsenophonus TaxID=2627083 RepID=UPI0028646C33|nr:filamentous hemagglutinin N-terminal domain-containing protein [Arsenophonus sp.]MDR5609764.1 filamentous hemagglutinin N-terminal domain-containing protein [Arsenophonus sp.]MDR5613456.1 filamentous hemagglutinin N-terminal domain-containing protein [Arsenophonus sp.]
MTKNKLSFIALSVTSILFSFHINASENIIVDSNKSKDLAIKIKDGIEHINITKTNKQGISHNYYQKFNVGEKGAVLDNTAVAANIIINEVTSAEKSFLKGNLRINGQEANVMVINPYGIECDGCSTSGVSEFTLRSRTLSDNLMDVQGHGAANGNTFMMNELPSSANQIVFKNISQPINANGSLMVDADRVAIIDGDLQHNQHYKLIMNHNEEIIANKVTIKSNDLSIDHRVAMNFDQLKVNIAGKVNNYGELNANSVDIDVQEDFINHRGSELNIVGKNNDKLNNSNFKAAKLKLDHAYLDINNTKIKFDIDEFNSLNGQIGFQNSIVTMNSDKFFNENDYKKNDQHHIEENLSDGAILLDNTKFIINSKEIINKAAIRGNGSLEIKANSFIGRNNIKIMGKKTTKIGQYTINKNGEVKITVNGLLDTYGSKIAASNSLIINTQKLKAKKGDIKIINRNKNIKPIVRIAD